MTDLGFSTSLPHPPSPLSPSAPAPSTPAPARTRSIVGGAAAVAVALGLTLGGAGGVQAQQAPVVFGNTDAQTCYQEARFGMAVSTGLIACDKALRTNILSRNDRVATFVNRGILRNRAKRFEDAIVDFNRAIDLDPQSGEAFLNRGNSYFFRRDLAGALTDYDRAIALETRDLHAAYFNRGLVLEATGRAPAALAAYRAALDIRPDFLPASARLLELEQQGVEAGE